MNAAAKALAEGSFSREYVFSRLHSGVVIRLILLVTLVLSSAFAVIYVKDMNRRLFGEVQYLQYSRDRLHIEWGQLLLEQSTLATQSRVQSVAQQQLDMIVPQQRDIIIVQEW